MALLVMKFGGTSVGSSERIGGVAKRVAKWARAGHQMVVVPSAMSGETNRLLGLAKELAPRGITVNAVLPGLVDTDGISPDVRLRIDEFVAMTPLGRLGRPDDIADIVAFLVSDHARWVTGQAIVAAGGLV